MLKTFIAFLLERYVYNYKMIVVDKFLGKEMCLLIEGIVLQR